MPPTRPLAVEQLEDRCVPATWANPWPDGFHLTLSFAPDGTATGSGPSDLRRTLDAIAPTAVWPRESPRASQTWASVANLNVALVGDAGQELGGAGRPQGDSRFGDLRLAAVVMPPDVLAVSRPFEATSGTAAGDVLV